MSARSGRRTSARGSAPGTARPASVKGTTMPATNKLAYTPADSQVYLIIRFNEKVREEVRVACIKEQKIIENYCGRIVGIANGVKILEGNSWPCNQSILVMEFKNQSCAQRWIDSDRKFKDKEWPYASCSLEIIMTPLSYLPPKNALTFQLIEMSDFSDPTHFQDEYVKKVTSLMDKKSIKHGFVASSTKCLQGLRNSWLDNNSYFLLHAYQSENDVEQFYYSDEYSDPKRYRHAACTTQNIVFQLDPTLAPPCGFKR